MTERPMIPYAHADGAVAFAHDAGGEIVARLDDDGLWRPYRRRFIPQFDYVDAGSMLDHSHVEDIPVLRSDGRAFAGARDPRRLVREVAEDLRRRRAP